MSSLRDAYKRLEVIYKETSPEAKEEDMANSQLDEFTKLKKKVHSEVKQIREVFKRN